MPDPAFWSLAYLSQHRYTLGIHCEAILPNGIPCNHSADLDWGDLIERFGPDYVFAGERRAEFLSHFRCSRCGGKQLGLVMTPAGK